MSHNFCSLHNNTKHVNWIRKINLIRVFSIYSHSYKQFWPLILSFLACITLKQNNTVLFKLVLVMLTCFRTFYEAFASLFILKNFSPGCMENRNSMTSLKGIVHPWMQILSSFTHPQVVPNLYECLCSAEDKGRYSEESLYSGCFGNHWLT